MRVHSLLLWHTCFYFFGPIYPRMLCSLSPFARRSCSISFCVNSFLSYSFAFVSVSEENSCIFCFPEPDPPEFYSGIPDKLPPVHAMRALLRHTKALHAHCPADNFSPMDHIKGRHQTQGLWYKQPEAP